MDSMVSAIKGFLRKMILAAGSFPPMSYFMQVAYFVFVDRTRWHRGATESRSFTNPILTEVNRVGFTVIEDYFTSEECAAAVGEMDVALEKYSKFVHVNEEDDRIFGYEHLSSLAKRFQEDSRWIALCDEYTGLENTTLFTLANRLSSKKKSSFGSGGGWHRDWFPHELKMLVYLTDVSEDNGPFEIMANSNGTRQIFKDMWNASLRLLDNRISNEKAQRLMEEDSTRPHTLTAKAGTVLLFDTSCIHRGKPLRSGSRYALTLYTGETRLKSARTYEHYSPVIKSQQDLADAVTTEPILSNPRTRLNPNDWG